MRWIARWTVLMIGMVWFAGCGDPKNSADREKPVAEGSILEPADGPAPVQHHARHNGSLASHARLVFLPDSIHIV